MVSMIISTVWSFEPKDFKLGPISSVTVFGQHIVILNDLQLAVDLFDRKSSVFSNRPDLVFCGQMHVL